MSMHSVYSSYLAAADNRIANSETRGIFVDLNRGGVSLKPNDFADELVPAHADKLVHGRAAHICSDHHWPRNFSNISVRWENKKDFCECSSGALERRSLK